MTVAFTQRVVNIHRNGCSAVLIVTWLAAHKMAAVSAQVLCTPYSHAPVYSVTVQSRIHRVYVCLAVTCHLHLRQNDQDLLCATADSHLGIRSTHVLHRGGTDT